MLEKDHRAFAGRLGSGHFLAVEHPAEAAVAQESDEDLNRRVDGVCNLSASLASDCLADGIHTFGERIEDAADRIRHQVEHGDRREALLDRLAALLIDIFRKLALGDALGHHGDLPGLVGIADVMQNDTNDDRADEKTDHKPDEA